MSKGTGIEANFAIDVVVVGRIAEQEDPWLDTVRILPTEPKLSLHQRSVSTLRARLDEELISGARPEDIHNCGVGEQIRTHTGC